MKPYGSKRPQKPSERTGLPAALAVEGILSKLGFDPAHYAVFDAWDREARVLAPGCEAVALQGSKICVSVPSAAHRQELYYSKKRIIDRLNQALGKTVITDIQFELVGAPLSGRPELGGHRGPPLREKGNS